MGAEEHKLYITPETRALAGWPADRLTSIADANIILITNDDIDKAGGLRNLMEGFGIEMEPNPLMKLMTAKMDPEQIKEMMFENTTALLKDEPGVTMPVYTPDYYSASPNIKLFSSDVPILDTYLIKVDLDKTPQDWGSMFTGGDVSNLPGTALDYNAFVMFHEAGHAGQMKAHGLMFQAGNGANAGETQSDQIAVNEFRKAVSEGQYLNTAVPEMFVHFREASHLGIFNSYNFLPKRMGGGLLNDDYDASVRAPVLRAHVTETMVNLDGTNPDFAEGVSLDKMEGMVAVNSIVDGIVGHVELSAAESKRLNEVLKSDAPQSLKDAYNEMLGDNSGHAMQTYVEAGRDEITFEQTIISFDALYQNGAFDSDPDMKLYADRLMNFYETHMPDALQDARSAPDYADYVASAEKYDGHYMDFVQPDVIVKTPENPPYQSGKPTPEKIAAAKALDEREPGRISLTGHGDPAPRPELPPPGPLWPAPQP